MNMIKTAGPQNVGQTERYLSIGAGVLLTLLALRRGWWRLVLAALGGALLYRGASGSCPFYGALGYSSAGGELQAPLQPSEDQVDSTVEESFPASDPPGWHTGSSFTQVSE